MDGKAPMLLDFADTSMYIERDMSALTIVRYRAFLGIERGCRRWRLLCYLDLNDLSSPAIRCGSCYHKA